MHFVYLLYSKSSDKFYVGSTSDLGQRLQSHNDKRNKSTVYGAPWKLVYYEAYGNRLAALDRERKLKNHGKGIAELKKRIAIREQKGAG